MRVTHVITRLIVGGAQENTIATVLGLRARADVEVNLISGPTYGPEGSLESDLANAPGILARVPELVRPVHPLKDWIALEKLEKILREQRPDIVHTHSGKAGILGRLAARRAKVPVIIHHIHGPSFGPFQGALANFTFRNAERYAAKATTHFICSAQAMAQLYLNAGIARPENYTRIFSGFRLEPFLQATNDATLRKKFDIPQDAFVIGKIGRLVPLKGHEDLVKAFAIVAREIQNARLLILGEGPLRTGLEAMIRDLNLRDKVILAGLVKPGEVASLVGIMDCVAHLSYREALSRALPQALAAAKPIVAYDFDGADEICLENETGFLVRTGDFETAANRVIRLAKDVELRHRLGQCGQKFVRENFAVDAMVEKIYQLYGALLARHSAAQAK